MILGSFVPSQVLADVASFMEIDDSTKLSLASPRANVTLFSHRAIIRKINEINISRNTISTWYSGNRRTVPLDDNVELAHKQIIFFLKTVYEVHSFYWNDHDIDDKIVNELIRINLENSKWTDIRFSDARLIASIGKIESLLARHRKKIRLLEVYATTSLITNEMIYLLAPEDITIHPLNSNDGQISTAITDEYLKSENAWHRALVLRGFLNIHLTFSAILNLFTNEYSGEEYPCFGTIGYQEMPAVLQYYHTDVPWRQWNSTLCNINNSSYLEFDEIFNNVEEGQSPTFGVSLERDSNGVVDNAVIPEELVDAKTFGRFKILVKAVDSVTSIESVKSKKMHLRYLNVTLWEHMGHNYLVILATIRHQPNARNERSQDIEIKKPNMDQSTIEDIIVKIIKSCSSIKYLILKTYKDGKSEYQIKMTDRLFTSLLEHAVTTEVREEWCMDLQLSAENMVRLRENKTAGLFQNLKIEASDI